MSQTAAQLAALYKAFMEKAGASLVSGTETITDTQVRFNVRVAAGRDTERWLSVVDHILQMAAGASWTTDISKQYFLGPDRRLRYGWRLIFQGKDLGNDIEHIVGGVRSISIKGPPIEEVRLYGSPNRSRTAGPVGSIPIGVPINRG